MLSHVPTLPLNIQNKDQEYDRKGQGESERAKQLAQSHRDTVLEIGGIHKSKARSPLPLQQVVASCGMIFFLLITHTDSTQTSVLNSTSVFGMRPVSGLLHAEDRS